MPSPKQQLVQVSRALDELKRIHPIEGYVGEAEDELREVGSFLLRVRPPAGRLLDVGCGAMDKVGLFRLLGYDCSACDDFQDPWHQRDCNRLKLMRFGRDLEIDVCVQDETNVLPWSSCSFDVVTILAVLEHLHHGPRDLLNAAGSLLKEGGILVVSMPNAVNLRKRLSVVRGRSNYPPVSAVYHNVGPWRGHVREFTLEETRQVLRWAGFELVDEQTFHAMLSQRLNSRLARGLYRAICAPWGTLKDSFVVAARKPPNWSPSEGDDESARRNLRDSVPHAVR